MIQISVKFNPEVEEISEEDLQAAAEKFDDIKANPDKYFGKKQDNSKVINILRKNAQSCINKAEKINTEVSGAWTYRRQRFADSATKKKDNFLKYAKTLNQLAELWEENNCPDMLKQVRSVGDLYAYFPRPIEESDGDWYKIEYPANLKKVLKLGVKSKEEAIIFNKMIEDLSKVILTPEQIKEKELKAELVKLRSANIPGFFPTPNGLIDEMIEYANIEEHHKILEPSAGIGSIVDRICEQKFSHFPNPKLYVDCCEIQYSLANILMLKGYHVISNDIFDAVAVSQYDRILMNPPFEKGQDIDHVLHCYNKFLKYGGILVSIMSSGAMSNSQKKFEEFRSFVAENNGQIIQNGQAFKEAFNSTGVSTIMLVIKKEYE